MVPLPGRNLCAFTYACLHLSLRIYRKRYGICWDLKDRFIGRLVVHHVLSLAGRTHDGLRAQRGKAKFATACVACHGADGKGNQQIGAPNLTDDVWLHGGTEAAITETIVKGRMNQMPAHKDFLDAGKIHLLTAYVLGLSGQAKP